MNHEIHVDEAWTALVRSLEYPTLIDVWNVVDFPVLEIALVIMMLM